MAQNNSQSVSLYDLLKQAETNYPLLKSKALDVQAVQKGIDISRSTFIPALDASYQVDRATYNNITGMVYPQFIIPISGLSDQKTLSWLHLPQYIVRCACHHITCNFS